MKKKGLLIALGGLCIVLTLILLFFLPVFNITDVQIKGCDVISEDKIKQVVDDNNQNIFAFSSNKAIKSLEENNYISEVRITKSLPRTLIVNVTEHKIRGYIEYMGKYLYLSDNGLVIDAQEEINRPSPIIAGLEFDTFTLGEVLAVDNPAAFEAMIELSNMFNKYQLMNSVLRVDVSNTESLKFYCDNVQVIYGELDGSTDKILTLIEVLKELDTSIPGTLDLTLPNPTFTYTN